MMIVKRMPAIDPETARVRMAGALQGVFLGDMMGSKSKGVAPAQKKLLRLGAMTNNSQMTAITLQCLARKSFDSHDLAAHIVEIDGTNHHFRQNKAMVRLVPLLVPHVAGPSSESQPWRDIIHGTMITHTGDMAMATNVAWGAMLWELMMMPNPPSHRSGWWIQRFIEIARPVEEKLGMTRYHLRDSDTFLGTLTEYLETITLPALRAGVDVENYLAGKYTDAYLLETVPAVLYLLEQHAYSAETALMMAVSLSCDSATYAAIVGGALGALHGPWSADWTQTLDQTTVPGFAATAGEIIESAIGSWM